MRLSETFYMDDSLKPYFNLDAPLFEQLMALKGEAYRNLEGRLTQRIQLGDRFYFIKQHRGIGWKEIFKNLIQGRLPVTSAKNEWEAIHRLETLGVSVPRVVAFGKRGINPAKQDSFILMEELAPTISLEDLGKEWQKVPPNPVFKRRLIEIVGHIARTLHENGINHRDFYICHFLLDQTLGLDKVEKSSIKLSLIDLHRAQIRRLTPKRWIIKDLVGLYFSSKEIGLTDRDRYRFMKYYRNRSLRKIMDSEWAFWQKVKQRGEQLYREHSK